MTEITKTSPHQDIRHKFHSLKPKTDLENLFIWHLQWYTKRIATESDYLAISLDS